MTPRTVELSLAKEHNTLISYTEPGPINARDCFFGGVVYIRKRFLPQPFPQKIRLTVEEAS